MVDSVEKASNEPASVAIPRLFDSHGDQIFGLGLRMCGSPEDAEDLVQETFMRAFRAWDTFEGLSAPSTWLYTIASRTCKRLRRRRSGAPSKLESFQDLLPRDEEGFLDVPSPEEGPLDEVLRREAHIAVEHALSTMPLKFRLAMTLKELGEFSLAEVAAMLGLKEATVKTRVYRARLHLAKQLKKRFPKKETGPPDFDLQVCKAIFKAKMDALDHGRLFKPPDDHACARCASMFASLDLSLNACREIADAEMPHSIREYLQKEFGNA